MSHDSTPDASGQVTAPSVPSTTSEDVRELLRVFGQATTSIVLLTAALKKQADRSDTIEKRLARIENGITDEALTAAHFLGDPPRIAIRHDGDLLIEVTSDLPDEAIIGREVVRYATLTEAEASDARDAAEEGCSVGASKVVWQIIQSAKKASL